MKKSATKQQTVLRGKIREYKINKKKTTVCLGEQIVRNVNCRTRFDNVKQLNIIAARLFYYLENRK